MTTIDTIRSFMEKQGIPGRDGYELAQSGKAFADGANFRIEIAGVERASTMEAMIKDEVIVVDPGYDYYSQIRLFGGARSVWR